MSASIGPLQGTLDLLVLCALAAGPRHGYGVLRWLRETTDEVLEIEEGALYPALHRLEERGSIASEWGLSPTGRRARFYRLTARGEKRLTRATADWNLYTEAVAKVLAAPA